VSVLEFFVKLLMWNILYSLGIFFYFVGISR